MVVGGLFSAVASLVLAAVVDALGGPAISVLSRDIKTGAWVLSALVLLALGFGALLGAAFMARRTSERATPPPEPQPAALPELRIPEPPKVAANAEEWIREDSGVGADSRIVARRTRDRGGRRYARRPVNAPVSRAGIAQEARVRKLVTLHADLIGGRIDRVSLKDLIESGFLETMRDELAADARLSILEVISERAVMRFAVGHTIKGRQDFPVPIGGLVARYPYHDGEIYWSNDVAEEPDFERHPRARPERTWHSVVSVPLEFGDRPRAVLGIVSPHKAAFSEQDVDFIELGAAMIVATWRAARPIAA